MRQPPLPVLRKSSGAFDLPSIITGVVVVGILAAGVLAAIFGVIPFAQDRGAKQDLSSIRTAEGVAKAKDNRFMDHQRLLDIGYLQLSSTEKTKVKADAKGTCYVGIAKSGTGTLFYSTDANTDPQVLEADTDTGCLTEEELAELIEDVGGIDVAKGAPENLKLKAVSALQARASWDAVKGASGYKVEYSIGDGEWALVREDGPGLTASVGALPEQTVHVRVYAIKGSGPSEPSTATVKLPDSTLKNPSFEQQLESWTVSGGVKAATSKAQTGILSAELGLNTTVSQVVTMPSDRPVLAFSLSGSSRVTAKADSTTLAVSAKPAVNGWTLYKADLSAFAGKTITLSFKGDTSPSAYLEDVDIVPSSEPYAPENVNASSRLGAATVTWAAPVFNGGTPVTSYKVTAWADGVEQDSAVVDADQRKATLAGVKTGASYTFTVAASNTKGASDESTAIGPIKILAGPIANPSFELGVEGWDVRSSTIVKTQAQSGAASLQVNLYGTAAQTVTVTPGHEVLTYWARGNTTVTANSASLVSTAGAANGSWTQYRINLSSYIGQEVILTFKGASSPYLTLDDVEMVAAMQPDAPGAVGASSRLGAATVTWAAPVFNGGTPVTSYKVTAWADGVEQDSAVVDADQRTATLTGVKTGASYTFTVAASNKMGASVQSAAAGPIPILAGSIANPGFEGGLDGWTVNSARIVKSIPHAGASSLEISLYGTASQSHHVLPGKTTLTYWARASVKLKVGTAALTPTEVATEGSWKQYRADLSSYAGKDIVLTFEGGTNSTSYIDDVDIVPAASPDMPSAVGASSRLGAANVAWEVPAYNGGSPVEKYTVTAWADGVKAASVAVAADQRSAALDGLTVGKSYTFTVTATNAIGNSVAAAAPAAVEILSTPISNPGLETGTAGWTHYGSQIANDMAHSGASSVKLPSYGNYIRQSVTVPADKTVLTFWLSGTASLNSVNGSSISTLPSVTEGAWTKYEADLRSYAGRTITVEFKTTGGIKYLDDFAFQPKG